MRNMDSYALLGQDKRDKGDVFERTLSQHFNVLASKTAHMRLQTKAGSISKMAYSVNVSTAQKGMVYLCL